MSVYDPPIGMLKTAIESILAQTFRDFEFLVINDGSQEEWVRGHLDGWASLDARMRVFHEPHRGLTATLNFGLRQAAGTYIARQDADDWSEPARLARHIAYLEEHPEIEVLGCATLSHRADGEPLWPLRLPNEAPDVAPFFWKGNPFVHGSTIFRRARALAIGGYREEFPCAQDYDFFWRLTDAGSGANLDEILYHYRYRGGAVSALRAAEQARANRATRILAGRRREGLAEDVADALASGSRISLDSFRAALKQADHLMLAGDFKEAGRAYFHLLRSQPVSALAWGKMLRLGIFAAIPPARESCFR
jgi:glycosyltransferase involved in cell wall biosynthesis